MCSRNYRQQLQRWLQVVLCSLSIFFFNNTGLLVFKLNISVASSAFNSILEETFRAMAAFEISPSIGVSRSRCREAPGQNSLPHRTPFGQHRRARRATTQTTLPPAHGTARPRKGSVWLPGRAAGAGAGGGSPRKADGTRARTGTIAPAPLPATGTAESRERAARIRLPTWDAGGVP